MLTEQTQNFESVVFIYGNNFSLPSEPEFHSKINAFHRLVCYERLRFRSQWYSLMLHL